MWDTLASGIYDEERNYETHCDECGFEGTALFVFRGAEGSAECPNCGEEIKETNYDD